ncbi:hypothetical protein [Halobaculum sp. P14]|uniref:hypothetical protein n=1 Tax=Halobaculum sp. P14 TaxID=3421638 RepID=UPI003EB99E00
MQPAEGWDGADHDSDGGEERATDGGVAPASLEEVQTVSQPSTPDSDQDLVTALEERLERMQSAHPAQDKLHRDQRDLLERWEQRGYTSRTALLKDLLESAWLSLGRVNPNWYAEVARDDVLVSCLVTSDRRTRYRPNPVDLEAAQRHRRRLAKKYLRPACRAGFREIRADAAEYVQEDNRVNLADVSMFAMRPAIEWLKQKQEIALDQFLAGFGSEDRLDRWLHRFDEVTLGQSHRIESDLDWRIELEEAAKRILLEDSGRRAEERRREDMAARIVLPAMALAPPLAMQHAQELREESDESNLREFDMTNPDS